MKFMDASRRDVGGVVEDTATFSSKGEISPGCRCCKTGRWMCVFLGQVCNLSCPWCPNDNPGVEALSVHGGMAHPKDSHTREEILGAATHRQVQGVSFSGGEPLLRLPELVDLASTIRAAREDMYLWAYSNGILMDEDAVERLCTAGIQEVRVDLAATSCSDAVVEKLGYLSKRMVATVEVPVLEDQKERLIACLPRLQDLGVTFLNLHDVYVAPRWEEAWAAFDRSGIYVDPVSGIQRYLPSIAWIHEVMAAATKVAPSLHVNECALPNLANQWLAFRWQGMYLRRETELDFQAYKEAQLPALRRLGLVL